MFLGWFSLVMIRSVPAFKVKINTKMFKVRTKDVRIMTISEQKTSNKYFPISNLSNVVLLYYLLFSGVIEWEHWLETA